MAKQLAEPVRACHAICVEYIWTNAPAVKDQVTGPQTCSCQLSGQIRLCLNLKLKIWLENPLWSGSLASARPQLLKSQDTPLQTSRRNSSELWVTAGYWFSPNYSGCKQPAAQRGKRGTLHRRELAADAAPSLPFHPSAPENPNIRPAASLPMLFSICHGRASPGLLHHTCFLTPVLLHQKPRDGGGSRMTNTSIPRCNANGGGGKCRARVGGGISSGQSVNCVALPAHPTFVSAFCWNACKPVIAEVFLAAESLNIDSNHNCTCCTISLKSD